MSEREPLDPPKVWHWCMNFYARTGRYPSIREIARRFSASLERALSAAADINDHACSLEDDMEGMVLVGDGTEYGGVLEVWRSNPPPREKRKIFLLDKP